MLRYLRERIAGSEDPRRFGRGLTGDRQGLWRQRLPDRCRHRGDRCVAWEQQMGVFSTSVPSHLIPISPANASNKDWVILVEAGTIVGPSTERIRVARSTQERRIVKKYDLLLRPKHYLVVEGYNPRIHAVYLCPQLYKYDGNQRLIALQGEEIGQLIAHALGGRIAQRRPWYEPSDKLPDEPIISTQALTEFDTVVVEMPAVRSSAATSA